MALNFVKKNIAISKATGAFFVDKNNQISYGGFKKTPFLFKKIEKNPGSQKHRRVKF